MTTPTSTELALLGGRPAFDETLHVGLPNVGDRHALLARIEDLLDRRWLTNRGRYVLELEQRICDYVGVKHCVAVCNATIGLELAIRAAELQGEVIVPSFTFVATAHALQWQRITPVFCDVDPRTHNIDPGQIDRLVTPRTTGIIGVHVWGRPCAVHSLARVAERHGLKLLFDAAHALGCSCEGRLIGGFGLAEVFSFHATKFVNAFEGGAVVTDDDTLAQRIRLMSNFGFSGLDNVIYIGTNGKMNEASAAMGLTCLEGLDDFVARNRHNHGRYRRCLKGVPGLSLVRYDETERHNYQFVVVEVDPVVCGLRRDELVAVLHADNVRARRYFHPGCHRMEPYRSLYPNAGLLLPETERLTERVLSLPTGAATDDAAIERIGAILRAAVERADEVRQACAGRVER